MVFWGFWTVFSTEECGARDFSNFAVTETNGQNEVTEVANQPNKLPFNQFPNFILGSKVQVWVVPSGLDSYRLSISMRRVILSPIMVSYFEPIF